MDGNPVTQREKQPSIPKYRRHRYVGARRETELCAQRVRLIQENAPICKPLRNTNQDNTSNPTNTFFSISTLPLSTEGARLPGSDLGCLSGERGAVFTTLLWASRLHGHQQRDSRLLVKRHYASAKCYLFPRDYGAVIAIMIIIYVALYFPGWQ